MTITLSEATVGDGVLLDMKLVDYVLLITYFVFVLGIGWLVKRSIKSSEDFFQAGRSIPAWMAGLAFISREEG